MKKYKLNPQKLLPFTNEEMEVQINNEAEFREYLIHNDTVRIRLLQDSDIQTWIDSGYLLEVKPREFWLGMDNDGGQRIYGDISEISDTWDELIHLQEID